MKIAFIGAHGTGKSSAAAHLASLIKLNNRALSVVLIDENAREISRLAGDTMNTPEFQRLAFVDHLTKEFTKEMMYDVVLCDRSCLDTLVYGLVYKVKLPGEYFSLALNHLNTFKHIFFIRPDKENAYMVDDGFRQLCPDTQMEIDKEFDRFLSLWGGKFTEIRTKDITTFDYLGMMNND